MKTLSVNVTKDGEPFIGGDFSVEDADYDVVLPLLGEITMTRADAAGLLSGYMHAREVGNVTEDMGKLAMIAAVYVLNEGDTEITIPLEDRHGGPAGSSGPFMGV